MQNAEKGQGQNLNGAELKIGIVQARFNESITNTLFASCRDELLALGVKSENIDHVTVPGALEVPVALQAWPTPISTTPWWRWAASSVGRHTTSSWWPTNRAQA
jgi:hypothetical protein